MKLKSIHTKSWTRRKGKDT